MSPFRLRLLERLAASLRPRDAGAVRIGRYRILRRLAEGGMGEIFLARAPGGAGFEKDVVLKRILPRNMADREAVRMFLDEARLMATLNHPNIVHVYDFGTARGLPFFTMEYVPGEDLGRIMKALATAGVPLPLPAAIGIIAEVAAGLHHAHEKRGRDGTPLQIVHRDISPSNVLVSYDGAVKVADFGIAKWTRRETETRYGALKGKIAYMSPEQCRAEPLDARSDVFGLGILLFELVTGTRLYQGTSDFAVLQQVVGQDAPVPSSRRLDCPPAIDRIILRALNRKPEQRFATARNMRLALEEFALQAKLQISTTARAAAMQTLFGGKITAWREAIQAGLSPAEYLAKLGENGGEDVRAFGPGELADDLQGLSGSTRTGTMQEGPVAPAASASSEMGGATAATSGVAPARRRTWWLPVAAAVVLAAGLSTVVRQKVTRRPPAAAATPPRPIHAKLLPNIEPLPSPPRAEEPAPPGTTAASRTPARNEGEARSPRGKRGKGSTAEGGAAPAEPDGNPAPAEAGKKIWNPDSIFLP